MKSLLVSLLLLCCSTAHASWTTWTAEQRQWYMASNVMLLADWATTRDMTRRYDEGYYERNIILGKRLSTQELDLYFVSSLVGHYFMTDWLSSKNRDIYLKAVTFVEGAAVANNLSIGLRLRF